MSAVLLPRLEFAPMHESDVDAVFAAEQRTYAFPWTRGNFTDSLAAGYSAWVCREDGRLVAYGVLMMAVDEAHILNLSVLPEHQGRGLGSELLIRLFHAARDHGAVRLILEVRPSNEVGIRLYRRFLFSEIGRRRNYYPAARGSREDAIVMARDL